MFIIPAGLSFHPLSLQHSIMQGAPPTTKAARSAFHIFMYRLNYLGYNRICGLPVSAQLHGWYLNAAFENPAR